MAEQRRPPKGSKAPPPYDEGEDSDVPTDVFHREALEDLESVPSQRAAAAIIRTRGGDQTTRDGDSAPKSPIEVEFVQQRGAAMPQSMWGMLDIYTKNRIYRVSSTMVCIEVIDRKTGARAKDHPMLGARMGGGQRRSDHRVEVADPIPVPGMDVVFKQHGGKFGQTSRIERVVLRVRVSTFKVGDKEPSWEEITGQFAIPKPKA